jgi:glycosyltransferase involved in cell wall biosynthesis
VLVVDERSSDRTRDIALAHGAVVIERDWTGFVDARRYALSQVHTPWMFALDADEALDLAMRQGIAALPDDRNGYWVSRDTYFGGRPLRMWRGERLLRLMRLAGARVEAHPAAGGDAQLHETYVCDEPTGDIPGTLLHFSYPDAASYRAKYAEYTDIEAFGQSQPVRANVALAAQRFVHSMLFRGALLDGPAGWYVAWKSATYALVVARKAGKR